MDLKSLKALLNKTAFEENNRAVPEFEGLSPNNMLDVLHDPFGEDCPIQFKELNVVDYNDIPMFCLSKYMANIIRNSGELKLTEKGFLPVKIVAELYAQGFIKEYFIESGLSKLYKEADSITISLSKILLELSGIIKKRNGKLSLTKLGEKVLANDRMFFELIFKGFITKYNWAYFDRYGDFTIGRTAAAFSLILLSKYGNEKRVDSFYALKYLDAFPSLIYNLDPESSSPMDSFIRCYSKRTFERFLVYFQMVNIEEEGTNYFDKKNFISKTEMFDKLFKVNLKLF
jgi:hypothetical protein